MNTPRPQLRLDDFMERRTPHAPYTAPAPFSQPPPEHRIYQVGDTVRTNGWSGTISRHVMASPSGFGHIYQCLSSDKDGALRNYALKVFSRPYVGKKFLDGYRVFRSIREKLVALGVPNIYFANEEAQLSDWVLGDNLDRHQKRHDGLNVTDTYDIVLHIAAIVEACMNEGVLHNDIKPANIMGESCAGDPLAAKGIRGSTLIDWDIAKPIGSPIKTVIGTPYYMSPERFDTSGVYSHTSDIYALGTTTLQLLASRQHGLDPYDFDSHHGVEELITEKQDGLWPYQDTMKKVDEAHRGTSDELKARQLMNFVRSAIRVKPEARPQSGKEMMQILTDKGNTTEI